MDYQTYSGSGQISLFPPMSCAFQGGTAHKFNITYAKEINTVFRCCETCGETSRLRCTTSNTWEIVNEPIQKEN